jgi:hypothetical protein
VKHLMLSEQPEYPVPWRTREYVDVRARTRALGCEVPRGVALLPGNFESAAGRAEFRYHEVASQVREAWRGVGLADSGPGRKLRRKENVASGSPDQDIPFAVFFGTDLPTVSVRPVLDALSMVASVLTADPRVARTREVRVDAIVERPNSGGYLCLEYQGSVHELVTLAKPIREIQECGPNGREQEARKRKSSNKEGGARW